MRSKKFGEAYDDESSKRTTASRIFFFNLIKAAKL